MIATMATIHPDASSVGRSLGVSPKSTLRRPRLRAGRSSLDRYRQRRQHEDPAHDEITNAVRFRSQCNPDRQLSQAFSDGLMDAREDADRGEQQSECAERSKQISSNRSLLPSSDSCIDTTYPPVNRTSMVRCG
jgi:hypothetical protein